MPVSPGIFPSQVFRRPHFPRQRAHNEEANSAVVSVNTSGSISERNFVAIRIRPINGCQTQPPTEKQLSRNLTASTLRHQSCRGRVTISPSNPRLHFSIINSLAEPPAKDRRQLRIRAAATKSSASPLSQVTKTRFVRKVFSATFAAVLCVLCVLRFCSSGNQAENNPPVWQSE